MDAQLARKINWDSTPLGAVSGWPEAQRVATQLAIESSHGVALLLGEYDTVLVNEGATALVVSGTPTAAAISAP